MEYGKRTETGGMTMKKRLLSLLLALTLCLALLPGVALAEGETIKEVSNETELRAALTNEAYSTVRKLQVQVGHLHGRT